MRFNSLKTIITFALAFSACNSNQGKLTTPLEEFSKNIRTTEARTPDGERESFLLPEGFEVQLYASEPDIGKPLNMAFDSRGRMWLTQSNEYPFPNDAGKDRITILEDTDQDGKADLFTEFADSLNIPIGITPVKDGAIAYSIPYVYHFIDKDGDDVADERHILLSGFEFKDTHGMINNFLRGLDGWIYADHGYKNSSKVVGTNSSDTVRMTSGNTFRFREDGSRVELTTTGRVNPFGFAYDNLGYMYGVDCHSSPIYQLIRGGDYPHFGKTPTGIGYAPFMMRHEYGSTALAGLENYIAGDFPVEYQNNFYYGDVVMSRVLRSSMTSSGTTPVPNQETDFIISDDPWFRPVDIKLGPDGALYIADFYNRIIGHYEVPLDHPGRDRERGRIWRVVYTGNGKSSDDYKSFDWSKADLNQLLEGLSNQNMTVRMLVSDELVDRIGDSAVEPVRSLVKSPEATPEQKRHGLWILYRMNALLEDMLTNAIKGSDVSVKVHALKILYEYESLSDALITLATEAMHDLNPHVQRAAVMVIAKYPNADLLNELIALRKSTSVDDTHLMYSVRQALRDHLRNPAVMGRLASVEWNEEDSRLLADVLVGVDSEPAAKFLLAYLSRHSEPDENFLNYSKHIARYLKQGEMDQLIGMCLEKASDDLDLQYALFTSIQDGLAQRGGTMSKKGVDWAVSLSRQFLEVALPTWHTRPFESLPYNANVWQLVEIDDESGPSVRVLASDPEGSNTGVTFSPTFDIPPALTFYFVGHKADPLPDAEPSPITNKIQLRIEGAENVIAEVVASGEFQRSVVQWDLQKWAGKRGYFVLIDGSASRRENIGFGSLEPAVVSLPQNSPDQITNRQIFACRIAHDYDVKSLAPLLERYAQSDAADIVLRSKCIDALMVTAPESALRLADKLIAGSQDVPVFQDKLVNVVGAYSSRQGNVVISKALPVVSYPTKKTIALALSKTTTGIDLLFDAASQMHVSPRVLLDKKVREQLENSMTNNQRQLFTKLTKDVKPPDEELQSLIDQRIAEFRPVTSMLEEGNRVFNQACGVCHSVKGQGGNIGPQLDGIGNWGLKALTEKVLDPNRNISQAFITYSIRLRDGTVKTGLYRREEGNVIVYANVGGQEFSIPKSDILEKSPTPFTLMPDQFSETLTGQDYQALMNYLLSLK